MLRSQCFLLRLRMKGVRNVFEGFRYLIYCWVTVFGINYCTAMPDSKSNQRMQMERKRVNVFTVTYTSDPQDHRYGLS